ncbi:MAG: hypothetical protein MZV63_13190 [Marinilabiliales bacterium]|nr:hypothetical protein [Marinilabiliales bacterium]
MEKPPVIILLPEAEAAIRADRIAVMEILRIEVSIVTETVGKFYPESLERFYKCL